MTSLCPGYKQAALKWAIEQLAEKEGITFKQMIRRIDNRTIPQLTEDNIKALDYTYCEVTLDDGKTLAFLVPAVRGHTAQEQARLYLRRESIPNGKHVVTKPRNKFLQKKAWDLFRQGRYLKPDSPVQ